MACVNIISVFKYIHLGSVILSKIDLFCSDIVTTVPSSSH